MTLCRLMVDDFENNTGRYDGECNISNRRYSNYNLEFGIMYCEGLIEEGYTFEPFLKFNLKKFIRWANRKFQGRPTLERRHEQGGGN